MSTSVELDALDLACDAIFGSLPEDATEDQLLDAHKAWAQVCGYDRRWRDMPYEVLAVEGEFVVPVVDPASGKTSERFVMAGKRDGMIRHEDEVYGLEHKTCSEEIHTPDAPYWRKLAIDSQVNTYALSSWQEGVKIAGMLYDVIRKPTIRPARITKKPKKGEPNIGTLEELTQDGTYYGRHADEEEVSAAVETGRETPYLYGCRLLDDCTARPDYYYQRRMIYRLDRDLLEWAEELWSIKGDIAITQLQSMQSDRQQVCWPRNSGSCMNFGTPCEYLGLCSGYDTVDSDNWVRRVTPHHELDAQSDSKHWEVLTHSSVRTFQTCKRKAYYRYELRLDRADREPSAALYYGSLIHTALEAWWSFFLKEE